MADLVSGWQGIAGTAIVISIIIAGIALGFGRAFSIKRLERFGADELMQSIINAAILGFAIGLSALVLQIGAEFSPAQNITCISNATPADHVLCGINSTLDSSFGLSENLIDIQADLGYYQTLELHFGNFSIQPLINLNSVSGQLAHSLYLMQFSSFALAINAQLLSFISSNWFGTVFAAGLVLRTFFLSRKFGAFLIAASISLIIFYPLALMMFQIPSQTISEADALGGAFLANSTYQTIPIIDLNNNNAIAEKIYNMSFTSGRDFTGDLGLIVQGATEAAADLFFYSTVVPLLALIATIVLIKELSQSFAGEIATEVSLV